MTLLFFLAIGLGAQLFGGAAASDLSTPNADICKLTEIAGKSCSVTLVKYQEQGQEVVDATLASVLAGSRVRGDVAQTFFVYYLETPHEGIIALGEFYPWVYSYADSEMFRRIGYDGAKGGGIGGQRWTSFSSRVIVRKGDQYCLALVMKPPFTGSLMDCGGRVADIAGSVGYMPGILN